MPVQYLLGALSVSTILGLSAYGACDGMSSCGTASILYSTIPAIVTYSYISMIMISTVFFYGFIIAIVIINKLEKDYTVHNGIMHLAASLVFGAVGMCAGKTMGRMSNCSFRRMAQKADFCMAFIVSLASVEITLVIGFLCSLLIIYRV